MDLAQYLCWFTVADQHLPHQHRISAKVINLDGLAHAKNSGFRHLDDVFRQLTKEFPENGLIDFEGLEVARIHTHHTGTKGCSSTYLFKGMNFD
ncbi:hypothetical protein CUAC110507_07410 [Cutibacterium acnes subsp. defendens]